MLTSNPLQLVLSDHLVWNLLWRWNSIPQVSISCVLSACAGAGYWELAFQCLNELMPRNLGTKNPQLHKHPGNVANPVIPGILLPVTLCAAVTKDDCGKLETKLRRFWISIFELQWTDFAWGWVLPIWYKSAMIHFSRSSPAMIDVHLIACCVCFIFMFSEGVWRAFENIRSNQMDALTAWK